MANHKGGHRGGRKAAPIALKIASGVHPGRINHDAPQAPAGAPEPPPWLDDFERADFNRMCERVSKLGLLSSVDGNSLEIHAAAYGRWRAAMDAVMKDGITIETERGQRVHPGVGIAERAEKIMLLVESLFGLNPSDRSRLKASEAAADPLEELLRRRPGGAKP